ncbi:hypothetical protein C9374_003433 [Naegleria lovaniensis]|uniref:Uncharacterized protein n=1 Tax=Naegleria lovaniensis TaxID=51637 RepID=A0AA88GT92_NAELO|nr:uncharacterized protein C9374_003433 [Naegleria lovaniensis]KAG2385618.1 hypothetical protein C9374_003433 [Naegleria lovaniensis]
MGSNHSHLASSEICISDLTCNVETDVSAMVMMGIMTCVFIIMLVVNSYLLIREIKYGSLFKSRLLFYILTTFYLLGSLLFFAMHGLARFVFRVNEKQVNGETDFNPVLFLSTHIALYWSETILACAFLFVCVNYMEIFLHSKGFSIIYSKEQTSKLRFGVTSIIVIANIIEIVLFIIMTIFFPTQDNHMVETVLSFQVLFQIILSVLVVTFFIVWIYVSKKSIWQGAHTNEALSVLTQKMFCVASMFAFLIILKAIANIFLLIYVSMCGIICLNVNVILSAATAAVTDLFPLISIYYIFRVSDSNAHEEIRNDGNGLVTLQPVSQISNPNPVVANERRSNDNIEFEDED